MAYIRLPAPAWEAYLIDLDQKSVLAAPGASYLPLKYILFSRNMPPDGVFWGKLERRDPQFAGNSVTFDSYYGKRITVSW
jgi:hypothetical protein